MIAWGDLNVRARGLGTHLLGRDRLEELSTAPDLVALADGFAHLGLPPGEPSRGMASSLELAVRRNAARRLTTLSRWAGRRTTALAVIFEDEDRRSLRAILRGALQGASRDQRLAGLIPTPSMPERALEALATLTTPDAVAALLAVWGHPYGEAIRDEAGQSQPDPLRLETLVNRTFAARALAATRRARKLRAYVRRVIDLENVHAALGLAEHGEDVPPELCFLEGGDAVTRAAFLEAARAGTARLAALRLSDALVGTPYGPVLARHAADPSALEGPLVAAQLLEIEQARRLDPLSPAPLIAYVLRLRGEALDLQRIIWGVSLGAPAASITPGFATSP